MPSTDPDDDPPEDRDGRSPDEPDPDHEPDDPPDNAEIAAEVRRLHAEVGRLHDRLDDLEGEVYAADEGATVEEETESASGPDTAPEATAEPDSTAEPDATDETDAPGTAIGDAGSTRGLGDGEIDLGVQWLGVVGALAVVVGVVFLVRLAIERGYLGPFGRVALGTAAGVGLLVGGRWADRAKGYDRWGRIVAGTGLAVAYFSVYAAYGFESYREAIGTPLWATLTLLTLLVGGTVVVSVRDRTPVVAGEAFLLAYVTAVIATDAATVLLTPTYVLLVASALVAVAAVRPWAEFVGASVPATYLVYLVWWSAVDPPSRVAVAFLVAAFGIYLAGAAVLRGSGRAGIGRLRAQVAAFTAFNGVAFAVLLAPELPDDGPTRGAVYLAVAAVLVGAAAVAYRRDGDPVAEPYLALLCYAGAAGFAVGELGTTLALAAAVAVAAVGGTRLSAPRFRHAAHALAGVVTAKLLVVDADALPPASDAETLLAAVQRPLAFLAVVAVFGGLAWWLDRNADALSPGERHERVPLAGVYSWTALGLAVVLAGLELSGVTLSAVWALGGLALLVAGAAADARALRAKGVAVLGVATMKVFGYDTRGLDAVPRVLSLLTLGVVLLAASYLYARYRAGESPTPFGGLRSGDD